MTTQATSPTPRRRAPRAASAYQFNARVIKLTTRPRLQVGDLVEMCGTVLPGNLGNVCIIIGFREDGWVLTESLTGLLDSRDIATGEVGYRDVLRCLSTPENLYRLDSSLKAKFNGRIHHV